MKLIDTHCHLYLPEFKDDLREVIQRAEQAGVEKFCLPAIDSTATTGLLETVRQYPDKCYPMIGLHPCSVKENYATELEHVEQSLENMKGIAIGEIGLDFYWDKTFAAAQQEVFEKQMQWALAKKLPIVIHTRNAMEVTITCVRKFASQGLRGIFHCFGGTVQQATEIIEMGFLLGIGGVITYKNAGLAETLEHIRLEHIVLETDAPYLAPVPFRGKRNESAYLLRVAEKLATIKNIHVEEVADITTKNAQNIFNI